MKFTLIKNLSQDKTMKPILTALLGFTSLYLVIDIFVKEALLGLNVFDVTQTLFGNEDEFIDPMTTASILELIHTEIFFMMMILLTLSAIFARVCKRYRLLVINITSGAAIASIFFLALSFFLSPSFVLLYLISFFLWHLGAIYISLISIWKLNDKSI